VTLTLVEKERLRKIINRWPDLSASQSSVLMFIFSNTIDWGKVEDRLKLDHFIGGVGAHGGLLMSKMTARRALENLVLRGALLRRRTPYGYVYRINFDWDPSTDTVGKRGKKEPTGTR